MSSATSLPSSLGIEPVPPTCACCKVEPVFHGCSETLVQKIPPAQCSPHGGVPHPPRRARSVFSLRHCFGRFDLHVGLYLSRSMCARRTNRSCSGEWHKTRAEEFSALHSTATVFGACTAWRMKYSLLFHVCLPMLEHFHRRPTSSAIPRSSKRHPAVGRFVFDIN